MDLRREITLLLIHDDLYSEYLMHLKIDKFVSVTLHYRLFIVDRSFLC